MSEVEVGHPVPAGLQLALALEQSGAMTAVSLDLADVVEFDRYESLGVFFGRLKRSASWWIGDWLIFGEATHAELMAQAMDATGLAQETLSHYANVCAKIPKTRRRPSLPFGVHAEVASMPPAAQKRWLDKAEKNGWGSREIRDAIKASEADGQGQLDGTGGGGAEPSKVDKALVIEVAWAIVRDMREADDDGFVKIPVEDVTRLKAALGIE